MSFCPMLHIEKPAGVVKRVQPFTVLAKSQLSTDNSNSLN